ncbi:MAG TPA: hypothetical protein VM846_19580 [Vicinamibacterales bacterium]|nr:hypothetical protein [Vicinamibacterales bacterium]
MQRFALAVVVALLTFTASGVSSLVVGEPCSAFEQAGREDASCPPTCITCGCCAQAVEPAAMSVAASPNDPIAEIQAPVPRQPKTPARDILHVPKRVVA